MALFGKKYKPLDGSLKKAIEDVENDIRDLINFIEIKTEEETKIGEGKKIEDDTAKELVIKLKKIATKVGIVGL